jgi:hypothetical protein
MLAGDEMRHDARFEASKIFFGALAIGGECHFVSSFAFRRSCRLLVFSDGPSIS